MSRGPRLRRLRPSPMVEVAMTAPLFVVYQLGLLFLDVRNGADWLTFLMMALLESSELAYVALVLVVGLVLRAIARRETADPEGTVLRTLAESSGLAILLLGVAGGTTRTLTSALRIPVDSVLGSLIVSAGAGFHEELFFRVILFGGGAAVLVASGMRERKALGIAAIASSFLFALAHHLGPLGEPLGLVPLAVRTVCGLYFAAIYRFRGFATAAYTHALYDVIVLIVLR